MAEDNRTYSQALAEIEETLGLMEREALDVDDLSLKVRRVAELIGFCRQKLLQTEEAVEKVLKDIEA